MASPDKKQKKIVTLSVRGGLSKKTVLKKSSSRLNDGEATTKPKKEKYVKGSGFISRPIENIFSPKYLEKRNIKKSSEIRSASGFKRYHSTEHKKPSLRRISKISRKDINIKIRNRKKNIVIIEKIITNNNQNFYLRYKNNRTRNKLLSFLAKKYNFFSYQTKRLNYREKRALTYVDKEFKEELRLLNKKIKSKRSKK